jgi:hypothetical protein
VTLAPNRAIVWASVIAGVMHLLLFVAVQPSNGSGSDTQSIQPPRTRYLVQAGGPHSMIGFDVRTVKSPVVFSLPSRAGFSREHLKQSVQTPRFVLQQSSPDRFLEVDLSAQPEGVYLQPHELMLAGGEPPAPGLPSHASVFAEKRPSAPRIHLSGALKERLLGGVVLPPELNREVTAPWEARASVSVSKQGGVEHVFLDQPLEPALLNQEVLRLLYGLRFKPGGSANGRVEVYSPAPGGPTK